MVNQIILTALGEVGKTENPRNSNKTEYGKWFGLDGVPWCGIFVSWVYAKANKPLPNIGSRLGFAGCQYAVAWFKKKGMLTTNPVSGDIVFFDWNRDGRYDHTGIFNNWLDKDTFITIEGNTAVGNNSNGGCVMIRKRKNINCIFIHYEN